MVVVDGTDVTTYGYDNSGQLIEIIDNRGNFKFIYDEVGNRIRTVMNEVYSTDYTYDSANQLLTAGMNSYFYDANGNRISKTTVAGTVYYSYDYRNMLSGITGANSSVSYTYDSDGKKVSRTGTNSEAEYFLFDGDTAILEGSTPDLLNHTAYLEGLNGLLSKVSPEVIMAYYYYDPQLGIFLQKDPLPGFIEDPSLMHPYMYTRNDPVNKIDQKQ